MNKSEVNKRAVFQVAGRVQGVGYRYFVQDEAVRLGLTGYAKNLFDGSVEVVAEGRAEKIDALAGLLERGPQLARVQEVKVSFEPASGQFPEFKVR